MRAPLLVLATASALALLPACGGSGSGDAGAADRPNVLLVSLDTLRADRLGCYGADRSTSPFLDRLAAEGARFEHAIAPASKTATSHMTMLTGMHPTVHGVRNYYGREATAVSADLPVVPELFQRSGYATAAITGGGMMSRELGFARGFDTYDDKGGGAPRVFDRAEAWLRDTAAGLGDQPFFLFVHTYEIHDPYTPPAEWQARFVDPDYAGALDSTRVEVPEDYQEVWKTDPEFYERIQERFWGSYDPGSAADMQRLRDLYDAGIAFTDDALGELWRVVEELGLDEDLLVVVTSDHGEEFGEHGGLSHQTVYDEVLRVPLIVRYPGHVAPGTVLPRPVQGADLTPSLAELCNMALQAPVQGRSWAPDLRGEMQHWDVVWAEEGTPANKTAALRWGHYKFIGHRDRSAFELYDLKIDPEERFNLVEGFEPVRVHVADLMEQMDAENRELSLQFGPTSVEMGDEAMGALQALGYAGDGPTGGNAPPQDGDEDDEDADED